MSNLLMAILPGGGNTIIVSEETCSKYIRVACDKYVNLHPEDTVKVKELLDQLSF